MFTAFFLDNFPPELTPNYPELSSRDSLPAHSFSTSELNNSASKLGHAYAGPSDVHSGFAGGGSLSSPAENESSSFGLSNLGQSATNSNTDLDATNSVLGNDNVMTNLTSLRGPNSQPLINITNMDTISGISSLSGGISELNHLTGTLLTGNDNLTTFPENEGIITDLDALSGTIGETYYTDNNGQLGGQIYLDPGPGDSLDNPNASSFPPPIPEPAAFILFVLGAVMLFRKSQHLSSDLSSCPF